MNNATRGLVAGGLGVALLAGGATFALWSDSAEVDGGTITAGNLEIEAAGSQWYDVSADRTDDGHEIDLDDFLIIPGDTIRGEYKIDAALAGDNMVAKLTVRYGGGTGDLRAEDEGVTLTYRILNAAGVSLVGGSVPATEVSTVVLRGSEDNTSYPAGTPQNVLTLPEALGGGAEFTVEVTAAFDADTPDQVRTEATADLADLTVDLEQVRTGAGAPGYDS